MIPEKALTVEGQWQKELREVFTDPADLLRYLELDPNDFSRDMPARQLFPMRVPRAFAARMRPQDPKDPLLLQVLPQAQEFLEVPGFNTDPLEEQNNGIPGMLHKYQSRVLLMVRGGCAVNCRYCFRRHFPYQEHAINKAGWEKVLAYIAADSNINEVIYSGGDPLMAKDDFLAWLTGQLAAIPHVNKLRLHTRLPVVIPNRISPDLLDWIGESGLMTAMVLHINHAQEIDAALQHKLQLLKQRGVVLLNQAVLLKDINDSAEQQALLGDKLYESGVLPYYLHLFDKVKGASHYDIPLSRARAIMVELIKRQPGYLVPKLVQEIGNQPGKTPVDLHLHPSSGERIDV